MFSSLRLAVAAILISWAIVGTQGSHVEKRPNVILIMSDDQDRLLNSCDHMPVLQREIAAKGTTFTNHFATVTNCCPSRASLLRGQNAHNTNITHVRPPGGNYDKWRFSGEDNNYLPHWIKKAGYQAEYVGKFLNGYSTANYYFAPKGWDHVDALLEPYIGDYNNPVWSANGQRPLVYPGFHQTDTVRVKALDRLERLISDGAAPFFLAITPYAPHVSGTDPPVPQTRYNTSFLDVPVPRFANWNPSDEIQKQKSVFIKDLLPLNSTQLEYCDFHHQRRLQALQGVDEIIEDVINLLEEKEQLENTYIIYTTDNGYHIGSHRLPAGKALPYIMDTNLPLFVRGPGIPAGVTSNLASAHLDFAPTFLEIMGLPQDQWPTFLDGYSLLSEWKDAGSPSRPFAGDAKEIINIEFWGDKVVEAPYPVTLFNNNTYKTLRLVTEHSAWMLTKWCTNEVELYNTTSDPWETQNLARGDVTPEVRRLLNRLNAVLMVTKSCEGDSCRNPWSVLQPPNADRVVNNLDTALDPKYDGFFEGIPEIHFNECIQYQDEDNEQPFYPPGAENGLGKAFRLSTDNWKTTTPNGTAVPSNKTPAGGPEQRYITLEQLEAVSRQLTDSELGFGDQAGEVNGGGPGIVD